MGVACALGLSLFARAMAEGAEIPPLWLRLMHYHEGSSGLESSISSPEFFLSQEGPRDARREWARHEELFAAGQAWHGGRWIDPVCAFPARAMVVLRAPAWPIAGHSCPEVDAWARLMASHSVSLVFSTAFAGNASSMFGHSFLKLNRIAPGRTGYHEGLLDFGVAFLADTRGDDGNVLRPLKGLFGGYQGRYLIQPYYELLSQYAYIEGRDLWEEPIALSPGELQLLVLHLFELAHEASAPYYFTSVNCTSMLAEILEVVRPDWQLGVHLSPIAMPSELSRLVGKAQESRGARFRPSARRRFMHRAAMLSREQGSLFHKAWATQDLRGIHQDPLVLDLVLDRVTMEKARTHLPEQSRLRAWEREVLGARSALAAANVLEIPHPSNNPAAGPPPRLVAFGLSYAAKTPFLRTRARVGWHDLLDPEDGHEPGYAVNFLDLDLRRALKGGGAVAELTLGEVISLEPWRSLDHQWSWIMSGGLAAHTEPRTSRGAARFDAAFGATLSTNEQRSLWALLPGLRLAASTAGEVTLGLGAEILWLARWSPDLRTLVQVSPYALVVGEKAWLRKALAQVTLRYSLSLTTQLEVGSTFDEGLGFSLGWLKAF